MFDSSGEGFGDKLDEIEKLVKESCKREYCKIDERLIELNELNLGLEKKLQEIQEDLRKSLKITKCRMEIERIDKQKEFEKLLLEGTLTEERKRLLEEIRLRKFKYRKI